MGQLVRYWVESKAFELSLESWRSSLKIVERSRRAWRFVVMGRNGLEWLMAMMEAVLQAGKILDFAKHLREGSRTFMAQRCSNKHGRFLTVTEYGGGGRWSVVVIPEGYEGLGWEKFAVDLRREADMLFVDGSKKETLACNSNPITLKIHKMITDIYNKIDISPIYCTNYFTTISDNGICINK